MAGTPRLTSRTWDQTINTRHSNCRSSWGNSYKVTNALKMRSLTTFDQISGYLHCSYHKNELICDYIKYDQHYKRKKSWKYCLVLFAPSCQKTRKFDKNDRKKIFLRVGANASGQLRSKWKKNYIVLLTWGHSWHPVYFKIRIFFLYGISYWPC